MHPTKFRFIWQSGFRGDFFFKSANQKQELPMVAMFVDGSGQNEQSLERTFHRCFLPSFSSFGWAVSEEKIKMWKVNGRQVMAKAHIAFGRKIQLSWLCASTTISGVNNKVQWISHQNDSYSNVSQSNIFKRYSKANLEKLESWINWALNEVKR